MPNTFNADGGNDKPESGYDYLGNAGNEIRAAQALGQSLMEGARAKKELDWTQNPLHSLRGFKSVDDASKDIIDSANANANRHEQDAEMYDERAKRSTR
jgi:hypothetical protein